MSHKNKVVRKYIPAGLQINGVADLNQAKYTPKQKKPNTKKNLFEDNFGPSVVTKTTPPKTICRNKSLRDLTVVDDFEDTTDPPAAETPEPPPKTSFRSRIIERLKKREELKAAESSSSSENSEDYSSDNSKRCTCVNCDGFLTCPVWYSKNLSFDDNVEASREVPFFKDNIVRRSALLKEVSYKHVIHGPLIPKQKESMEETCIDVEIQSVLRSLKCVSATEMQSYVWPAIQLGLNVCMVAPSNTGKTLAYLPFLSSFALEKRYKYREIYNYEGPLSIILCKNNQKCIQLLSLLKTLVANCLDKIVVDALTQNITVQKCCDILITTPSSLENSVRDGRIKLKRLCHLAIEDASSTLKIYHQNIEKIFTVIDKMHKLRPHNKPVQLIIDTCQWSADVELLVTKLYVRPLVYFEDFLEGALYSRIAIRTKTLNNSHKVFYLNDILKKNYMTHKSVVFCDDEDISKICECLNLWGIESISICSKHSEGELFENAEMWKSLEKGHYKVLLCTDSAFEAANNLLFADWLIHYNIPFSWTELKKRFRCLSANFSSPLEDEFHNLCTFMAMDDKATELDFMDILQRHSVLMSVVRR